mmetsp:Transcript_31372/g.100010  ORF Transcript_31372/g.100010 Transcript_31372/m.100010 type:complete len:277 (-) Transcript_31372:167-997(-)
MTAFHFVAAVGFDVVAPYLAWSPWFAELVAKYVPPALGQLAFMSMVHFVMLVAFYMTTTPFAFEFFRKSIDDRRALEEQLANYTIRACKCYDERDRFFVEAKVLEYFGTLEEFDRQVRQLMRQQMEAVLGSTIMPYTTLLMMEWAHIMFAFAMFVHTPEKNYGHIMIMMCAVVFATDMLAMLVIQLVVRCIHDSPSQWLQKHAWWIGPITLASIFGMFTTAADCFVYPKLAWTYKAIPVVLMVLITWKIYGVFERMTCSAGPDTDAARQERNVVEL